MKIRIPPSHALTNFLILSLSTCIVVSALSFDSVLHDLQQTIVHRSLPGSLALAPEGAVGYYQPPPGPITHGPIPAATPDNPEANATPNPGDSNNGGLLFESKQALAATEGPNEFDESRQHIPSVAEMDAMIRKAQTASASSHVLRSLTSLVASIFFSLWQF
ncbi:hypothetical protein BJX70DRAFT_396025 [Aspergillus crustosus]